MEEALQLDLSPYNLQEIRSMLFQKVHLIHQQIQDKARFLNQNKNSCGRYELLLKINKQ